MLYSYASRMGQKSTFDNDCANLTGCTELITILNRFGHRQLYINTLEVEMAMCNSITESVSVLPPSVSTQNNSVIHFCWNHFDLNEETPPGTGIINSTRDIVIQEVSNGTKQVAPDKEL